MTGIWLASFVVLWILVLVQAFLIFAILRQLGQVQAGQTDQRTVLPLGVPAPEFEIPDLDGRPFSSRAALERGLLLIVTSSTCPGCAKLMPALQSLHAEAGGPRVPVWTVCVGEEDGCRSFAREHDVPTPVLRDVGLTVWNGFRLKVFPTVISIDRKGVIQGLASVTDLAGLQHLRDLAAGGKKGDFESTGVATKVTAVANAETARVS